MAELSRTFSHLYKGLTGEVLDLVDAWFEFSVLRMEEGIVLVSPEGVPAWAVMGGRCATFFRGASYIGDPWTSVRIEDHRRPGNRKTIGHWFRFDRAAPGTSSAQLARSRFPSTASARGKHTSTRGRLPVFLLLSRGNSIRGGGSGGLDNKSVVESTIAVFGEGLRILEVGTILVM